LVELALGALANRHAARLTPIVCRSVWRGGCAEGPRVTPTRPGQLLPCDGLPVVRW